MLALFMAIKNLNLEKRANKKTEIRSKMSVFWRFGDKTNEREIVVKS